MITKKDLLKIVWVPVFIASLCCLTPVVLVLFSLSTVAFAASVSDVLYGQYGWWFRLVGLALLIASYVVYLRRSKGICTIAQATQRRREVLNGALLVVSVGVLAYIVWLHIGVELIGHWLEIW